MLFSPRASAYSASLRYLFLLLSAPASLSHQLSPCTPSRPRHRQSQHGHKYHAQPRRSRHNPASPLRQDRQSSIHKFNMHPIHQQRSPPQLPHRTKSHLSPSPPAPRINKTQNHHDHSTSRQKKIRTRMPIVVHRIHRRPPAIQRQRRAECRDSRQRQRQKSQLFPPPRKIRKQTKSHRQSDKRESRPRKYRKQPHLRLIENVHAIHIRLHWPRQKSRPPGSPHHRSRQSHRSSSHQRQN